MCVSASCQAYNGAICTWPCCARGACLASWASLAALTAITAAVGTSRAQLAQWAVLALSHRTGCSTPTTTAAHEAQGAAYLTPVPSTSLLLLAILCIAMLSHASSTGGYLNLTCATQCQESLTLYWAGYSAVLAKTCKGGRCISRWGCFSRQCCMTHLDGRNLSCTRSHED